MPNRIQRLIAALISPALVALLPRAGRAFVVHRLVGLPAIAGAEGEGGDGGEGGGEPAGDGGGEGGEGGGAGDGGESWTPPDRGTWDNAQRQLRETRERLERIEREREERERKAQEDEGKFQELYEKEKAEREREREERERERQEIERERRRSRGERLASRLKFRDPTDALSQLSDDELETDAKAERALKKLAEKKPYLITDSERRPTRDVSGGDRDREESGDQVSGVKRLEQAYARSSSND